jgi:hypothetical protein
LYPFPLCRFSCLGFPFLFVFRLGELFFDQGSIIGLEWFDFVEVDYSPGSDTTNNAYIHSLLGRYLNDGRLTYTKPGLSPYLV